MNFPVISIDARFWRMLAIAWQHRPLSGDGAAKLGGRWNRPGQAALYLSADHATAIAEFHQDLVQPGTLAPYDIRSSAIVDLTRGDVADEILFAEWRRIVAIEKAVPPGWKIVDKALAGGAHGVLVPSAQRRRGGVNLVLWRWSADLGNGAHVRLIDPTGDLQRG